MAKKTNKVTPQVSPQVSAQVSTSPPKVAASAALSANPNGALYPMWWLGVLFLLAFLVYANTLGHGYAFDDAIVITENSFTKKGFGGMRELATRDFFDGIYGDQNMQLSGGRYRPLSLLMFAVEYEFFGQSPAVGHFLNVLFYALTVPLLFVVLGRWLREHRGGVVVAAVAALLFAAHPIHTEVVANIKSRDEIMALFMLLVGLLGLDRYFRQGGGGVLGVAVFCFFMGMLSKENTFAYALLLPIIASAFYNDVSVARRVAGMGTFGLAAVAYFGLRYMMVGGFGANNPDIMENPFVNSGFGEKFGTIGVILLKYLQMAVLPTSFAADYSYNQIPFVGLGSPLALLGWALYGAMGIFGGWAVYRRNAYGVAVWAFLLPLGPTTNILFNIGAPMAERFIYMSSLGSCLAMGLLFVQITGLQGFKQMMGLKLLPIVALVAGYAVLTVQRNPDWKDNATLFAKDVKTCPNSAKMQYYYGNTLLQAYLADQQGPKAQAYLAQAEAAFLKSAEINPKFHTVLYNLGLVAWNQGDGAKAAKYLQAALALQPQHILSTELLGKVNARFLNNPAEAKRLMELAIYTYRRESADNYSVLGIIHAMENDFAAAVALFEKALKIDDKDPTIWQNYAQICVQAGDVAKSQAAMQRAEQLRAGR